MKFARLPLCLALAAAPLIAHAEEVPRAKMELKLTQFDVQLRDFTFPSGLRVVFQEDHSQPVVSITSVTDRGSTADPPGLEGIAHVCEHMWFRSKHKGSDGTQLPKVWDLLEELGANLNAFTADDQTVYMTVAPADKLVPLLRLEGLRMRDASAGVENDVLLVEREVVRNELRMRYENSVGAVFGQVMVRLFPKEHPYGRAAYAGIGNHDSLNAITLADIQKFFKVNYGPDKTTIFVVGDFDADDASKYLAEIGYDLMADPKDPKAPISLVEAKPRVTGAGAEPPPPVEPAEIKGTVSEKTVARVHGPVEKPFLAIGWTLPAGWRATDGLMQVAAGSMQPAIYQELNPSWEYRTDADIESVGCGAQPQLEGSMAYCTIDLASADDGVATASKALDGLYRVWTNDESEIARRFQQYIFDYSKLLGMAYTFQQLDLIASLFTDRVTGAAMYTHYTGDLQYFSRTFDNLGALKLDEMQKTASKYLNRSRAVAVIMEPYSDGDILTDSSDAGYRGARREDRVESVIPTEVLTPEFIAKTVIPPDAKKIKETTLPNGMKAVVMPYSSGPLMQARITFGGGSDSSDDGVGLFAAVMNRNESWAYVDTLRIAGFDDFSVDGVRTTMDISASAGNVDDAMYVLRERMDKLLPDTNGRIDWVKARKKGITEWMKEPAAWSEIIGLERLLPNHIYSRWLDHGDYDTMDGWSQAVVEKVYKATFRPDNARIVLVGNVSEAAATNAINTYWANWKGWRPDPKVTERPVAAYPPPTPPPARTVILFDKEKSSQTEVRYSCQIETVTAETLPAAQVLGSVLSEGTWLALREQTGASYGAYAYTNYPHVGGPSFLNMESLVQNDAAVLAVKSFLGLGEDAKNGKMDPRLVAIRKYSIAQEYVQGQQSTAQMIGRLTGVFNLGLGLDWFQIYPKRLGEVTIPQMVKFMDRCVGHEVVTLVGPVNVIKPLFDKEGVAVEVFDWKQARLDYATKYEIKGILKAEEKKKKEEAKKKEGGK